MQRWALTIQAISLILPVSAFAGIPVDEPFICPVGGEEFTITGTSSCSSSGRTMSYRPQSSCDFVTRLPVCPSNGLPVYQKFSDEQIARLEDFIETPEYQELMHLPPWQRAYGVAEYLDQAGSPTGFSLALNAMWYESDSFFDHAENLARFQTEADQELERLDAEKRPYLQAIVGYTLSKFGQIDEAKTYLDRADATPDISEYLQKYIVAIRTCQTDMSAEGCGPDDRFEP